MKISKIILRWLRWNLILWKRFFKKPSFLLVLLMIPVVSLILRIQTNENSGALHIGLVQMDKQDVFSTNVMNHLTQQDSIIEFTVFEDEQEADWQMDHGNLDSAWIFSANCDQLMEVYTKEYSIGTPLVTIKEREDNVFLQLSHEKLYSSMYPYYSYSFYNHFVKSYIKSESDCEEEILQQYYNVMKEEEGIVQFAYNDNTLMVEDNASQSYLTTPIRGMLAILVLVCGFATTLYYLQDKKRNLFRLLSKQAGIMYYYAYQWNGMLIAAIIVVFSFYVSGIHQGIAREILTMLCYVFFSTAACGFLGVLCNRVERLSSIVPFFMLLSVLFSPIYFTIRKNNWISYMFPTYYYLNAQHSTEFLRRMILNGIILFVFTGILFYYRKKTNMD